LRRFYLFTRIGQASIGLYLLGLGTVMVLVMRSRFVTLMCTPCLEAIYGGTIAALSATSSAFEQVLRSIPIGLFMLVPTVIAASLYIVRVPRGSFSRLKDTIRRGVLTQRWLIRMAWTTPLVILVAMLFGVTSFPVLITVGVLNVLSHVFLIEMDRTNLDLPYVDWAPLFLSMLLSLAIIIVVVAVGFDSGQLRSLPQATRFILIGYLAGKLLFYFITVMHYGGFGQWKKLEYSDNAFSLNDVTILTTMMLLFVTLLSSIPE
jgi:hypothetical protein